MSTHDTSTHQGPPRGRGHYSDDGSRWWDDTQQRWFRTTDDTDVLEIEVEDAGHTSMLRSIATTLTGQYGAQSYRFVGRARSGDPRWGDFTVASGTFPVLPLQLPIDRIGPDDAYGDEMRAQLDDSNKRWSSTGGGPPVTVSAGGQRPIPDARSTGTHRRIPDRQERGGAPPGGH